MRVRHILLLAGLASLALFGACTTASRVATAPAAEKAAAEATEGAAMDPSTVNGIWQGVLEAGGQKVRLVFNLEYSGGAWKATMDSPDQGAKGIAVRSVTLEGSTISIDVASIAGRYEGTVEEGAAGIEGKWLQGGGSFALNLARVESVEIIRRPQDPIPPYPYQERQARFRNEKAGLSLAGTLTVPPGNGPFPAVVLVSGSGAQNRNEEIMNHRPFLVLADYLTRRGIAVLRYDDRGVAESEGDPTNATTRDFADDAAAAFRYLASQRGIDAKRVGIVGHSEGGIIAPMVASENPAVAFIVLLAGPGCQGYDLMLQQSAAILRAVGASQEQIATAEEANRRIYDVVLSEPDSAKAEAKVREILTGLGMSKEAKDAQVAPLLSPWYRYFLAYDPWVALKKVTCPVLAIGGSLDLQVPAELNLAAIEHALREGGNTRVTTVQMEGLNHLFQHAGTGLVDEYATIDETFAPEAMQTVADWILANAGQR